MNIEITEVEKMVASMAGWLSPKEGAVLYEQARKCTGKGVIVEIGSWQGKSSVWLGRGSKSGKGVKIFAIDPHVGSPEHQMPDQKVWTYPIFQQNIKRAGVDDVVVPIVKTSQEANKQWNGQPIEFLWIDGAHEWEMVHLDYQLWEPLLVEGGFIGLHDTFLGTAPKKVVNRYLYLGHTYKKIRFVEGITYAQKTSRLTCMDKLRNRYALLLRNLYLLLSLLANKLRVPASLRRVVRSLIENFR